VRSDNGPELTSRHYLAWFIEQKIAAIHIQPGRPHAERTRGEFPWPPARRMFERELVPQSVGRTPQDRRLAHSLQHGETPFAVGIPDAGGVRTGPGPFAVLSIESRKRPAASRPSPTGACGDLDPTVHLRGGPNMTAKRLCEVVEWCGRKMGSRHDVPSTLSGGPPH
jgi:hypothetical protein